MNPTYLPWKSKPVRSPCIPLHDHTLHRDRWTLSPRLTKSITRLPPAVLLHYDLLFHSVTSVRNLLNLLTRAGQRDYPESIVQTQSWLIGTN